FDITINLAEFPGEPRIAREVFEGTGRLEMKQPPEVIVARHSQLPRAQDVGGREIHETVVVGPGELLQELRVIVQHQRTGVLDTKAVKQVGMGDLASDLVSARPGDVAERASLEHAVVGYRP